MCFYSCYKDRVYVLLRICHAVDNCVRPEYQRWMKHKIKVPAHKNVGSNRSKIHPNEQKKWCSDSWKKTGALRIDFLQEGVPKVGQGEGSRLSFP